MGREKPDCTKTPECGIDYCERGGETCIRNEWFGSTLRSRLIHYELHDRGDAFFISCREGADQHKWDVYDSRIGGWQSR